MTSIYLAGKHKEEIASFAFLMSFQCIIIHVVLNNFASSTSCVPNFLKHGIGYNANVEMVLNFLNRAS